MGVRTRLCVHGRKRFECAAIFSTYRAEDEALPLFRAQEGNATYQHGGHRDLRESLFLARLPSLGRYVGELMGKCRDLAFVIGV